MKVNSSKLVVPSDVMMEYPSVNSNVAKNVNSAAGVSSQNDGWSPDLEIERSIEGATYKRLERRWSKRYRYYLRLTDLLIVSAAVVGAQFLRFGNQSGDYFLSTLPGLDISVTYTILSATLVFCWMASLELTGTRDHRLVGAGIAEYKQVVQATLRLFGGLAIVDLLFKLDISRGYLLFSFPSGLLLLLLSRWGWRQWLHSMRRKGRCLDRALLVGESKKVRHVANEVARERAAGYKVVGAVTDSMSVSAELDGAVVNVDYSVDAVPGLADKTGADTVVFVGSDELGPEELRQLGWIAEERELELIVAPALTDIAGPRIHSRSVAGLPLIHIEYPEITGFNYWIKRLFDIVVSALLILVLSPLLLIVAAAIKISSPGPIFYRQERIGKDGKPFDMLKFRSMIVDADSQLQALLEAQGTADKPLFKVEDDPRITKIGKFIRRYSIDELPQLLNAFLGTMSLVGPRPQVSGEVALYDNAAFRRLMVKPGLTGLWQVSGRSNLSWEDSIRLDLYYVENWSMTGDLLILLKTLKAVVGSDGAY